MHVDIDESRRHNLTGGIDGSHGRRVDSARDRRDLVAANADVGSIPGASRSINHPGVSDDEVVRRLRAQHRDPGRDDERKTESGTRKT